MKCTACRNDNEENAQFCGECGTNLISNEAYAGTELPMVNFVEAISLGFSNYFNFSGRATRAEYWWFILFLSIGGLALSAISLFAGIPAVLDTVFRIVTLIPFLALGARRLHDINRSGWWLLGYLGYILLILPGLVMTIILIIWGIKRGDTGPNKYGPDPRQPISQQP